MKLKGASMTNINIKKARQQLGLTQAALAKELGFKSSQIISNMESGDTEPQKRTLLAVECLLRRQGLIKT
jgi:transcriptional regulator with XRE-family HTH domain